MQFCISAILLQKQQKGTTLIRHVDFLSSTPGSLVAAKRFSNLKGQKIQTSLHWSGYFKTFYNVKTVQIC